MKHKFLALSIALVTLCSCSKADIENIDTKPSINLSASVELGTNMATRSAQTLDSGLIIPAYNPIVEKSTEPETQFPITTGYSNLPYGYSYCLYSEQEQKGYEILYKGFTNFETEIKIDPSLKLNPDTVYHMYMEMQRDCPELWYIGLDTYTETDKEGNAIAFKLDYRATPEEVSSALSSINEICATVYSYIPADCSLYDKYVFLHDFVILNAVYNEDYDGVNDSNMLGIFLDKKATCVGFADAYTYLLKYGGIATPAVVGTIDAPHQWNCVPYGEYYYHMDVGMDNVDSAVNDWCPHCFCLVSDEMILGVGRHTISKSTAFTDYPTPACIDSTLEYRAIMPEQYIIKTAEDFQSHFEDLVVEAIKQGRNTFDLYFEDYADFLKVEEEVFNSVTLRAIMDYAETQVGVPVDKTKFGVSFENWNKTMIIHIF